MGFEKLYTIIGDEKERFSRFGIEKVVFTDIPKGYVPFIDRIRWMTIKFQFRHIVPIITRLSETDKYTSGHLERVARMTYRFCLLTQMNRFYRKSITLSAYCHDIGKIHIKEEILNKKGKLTDEEFEEIKKHPQNGADMLNGKVNDKILMEGVLYHQERWDGRGYPTSLKEKNIPFTARIIAVADSIDAMMSDRPYRKALSSEECMEEIRKNMDIMYDSQIAGIYLDNWDYIVGDIYN